MYGGGGGGGGNCIDILWNNTLQVAWSQLSSPYLLQSLQGDASQLSMVCRCPSASMLSKCYNCMMLDKKGHHCFILQ